jgi:cob(I)alamin adenosyltransferase
MTPFFTGKGDDGTTGLLGEGRVSKHHPQIEAIGAVDEATAALGMARSICRSDFTRSVLLAVQRDLYGLMAEAASTLDNAQKFRSIDDSRVAWLENQVEEASRMVDIPREFIVPGDSPTGAIVSLARTIVRRAERRVSELLDAGLVQNDSMLPYLNRLSSLCFVLELLENKIYGAGTPTLAKEDE